MSKETHKLNKEEFLSLFDEDIKMKEYKRIIELVDARFAYIMYTLFKLSGIDSHWYDYDNEREEGENGYFDPVSYKERTGFTGSFGDPKLDNSYIEDENFPTRWFYEDFEKEIIDDITERKRKEEEKKEKERKKLEKAKAHKEKIIASIKSKLEPHELACITFK